MRRLCSILMVVVTALHWFGAAAGSPPAAAEASRPRVALVLGGGGAKGAAHIGVLRALEELRVPVDCVAGTSMGALVGATFAAGTRPADIEAAVLAVDWSATVGASLAYSQQPIQRKLQGTTYSNRLELGLRAGRPATAGGLLNAQAVESLLRDLVATGRRVADFDDLPLPFRAVATDMLSGEMVVLGNGDLALAMRASMAVPGAFAPVTVGSRVLADGGQLRNLPVDVGRSLCGDRIIAVFITTPAPDPADLRNPLGMLSRSLDVMIDANTRAQLDTLTDQDVSIAVDPGEIGSIDFNRAGEAIPRGYAAAMSQAEALRRYALSEPDYLAWRTGIDQPLLPGLRPGAVVVTGLRRVNPDFVRSQLQATVAGGPIGPADIREDTDRIYATGDFEAVQYRFFDDTDPPRLIITATEKSQGPDFLRFDLGLAASNGGDFGFVVLADHSRTWVNRLGGEWRNDLQIGSKSLARMAFTQPLDLRQRYFVQPSLRVHRNLEDFYVDGKQVADYNFDEWFSQLAVGVNLGTRVQLAAGLEFGAARAELRGAAGLPEFDWSRDVRLDLRATYDTRNSPALATRGSFATARYLRSGSLLGGEQSYGSGEALVLKAIPVGEDSLDLIGAGGKELGGELPFYQLFRLGGLRSFPGLERFQLRGRAYWTGSLGYNRKLGDNAPLFGQSLYGGLRLTAGRVSGRVDEISEGSILGLSVNLNGRTPVGPFLLSLGATDNGFWQLQLGLGRPVTEASLWDDVF